MKIINTFILFLLPYLVYPQVDTISISAEGILHLDYDQEREMQVLQQLLKQDDSLVKAFDDIFEDPNDFNPIVLFVSSSLLFDAGKREESLFWFYVAQLRTLYDIGRSVDKSCEAAFDSVNEQFSIPIYNYVMYEIQNKEKLKRILTDAVAFVLKNEETYDHRWVNNYGMESVAATFDSIKAKDSTTTTNLNESTVYMELSLPKKDWPKIKESVIKEFLAINQELFFNEK